MKTDLVILSANLLLTTALATTEFQVTFLPSSSATYQKGFFHSDPPGASETADPAGPFDGKPCAFMGYHSGGSQEHIGNEYLIYRMQLDFARDVYFDSFYEIANGAQLSTSFLRVLTTNRVVLRQIALHEAVNVTTTNRIHVGLVGRSFIIDCFDQSTTYRWRGRFGVAYLNTLPLTVPTFIHHPLDQEVLAGATVQIEASALGPAPLNYRWQFNGVDLVDDGKISGSGTSTLQIQGVDLGDAGAYRVVVSNAHGSITSNPALLSVLLLSPAITKQPEHRMVVSGSSAGFTVAAHGSLPLTFQWQRNGADVREDGRITGSRTPSLAIAAAGLDDLGIYTVTIRNDYGSVTSIPAALTVVLQPPDIISDPEDQEVFSGWEAVFSATAVGSLPLHYQWYRDELLLVDGARIRGAQTATLTLADTEPLDLGHYMVEVRNAYGATLSFPARLTVIMAPPGITSEPRAQRVALGSTVILQVAAMGSLPLSYQWERDGIPVVDGATTSGAATSALTLSGLGIGELGDYRVIVQNPLGLLPSKSVSVSTFGAVLRIRRRGDEVVVSWSEAGNGARLQKTSNLASLDWLDIPESESQASIALPLEPEPAFFRLSQSLRQIRIDFEDLPRLTYLTDQYQALGLLFSADGDAGKILNHTDGDEGTADFGSSGQQSYNCGGWGLTKIAFLKPVFRVGFRAGDGDWPSESFVIRFYSLTGVLLAEQFHTTHSGPIGGGVDVAYEHPDGIGGIELRGSPGSESGFQIDDLTFSIAL
ncbi:MAG: immunoglobulin domain-containing protein [Verrucomicrobiae bacterium]|nr:immunoglobulin domain-containing protein [Verrucomicrobiae bacterium]